MERMSYLCLSRECSKCSRNQRGVIIKKINMLILMKAARIVRNDIFSSSGFKFNASFPPRMAERIVAHDSQVAGDNATQRI